MALTFRFAVFIKGPYQYTLNANPQWVLTVHIHDLRLRRMPLDNRFNKGRELQNRILGNHKTSFLSLILN